MNAQAEPAARFPNLFIIGAPKCGTTSLAYYLGQYPDVFTPRVKEPTFFCQDLTTDSPHLSEREYLKIYARWEKQMVALDVSTAYFVSRSAADLIYNYSPKSKIIAIIRNPVDAMYSAYWYNRWAMVESEPTFEQAIHAELSRSQRVVPVRYQTLERLLYKRIYDYPTNLKRYFDRFKKEDVKVLIFEEFVREPKLTTQHVVRFLGLNPNVRLILEKRNASKVPVSESLANFIARPPVFLSKLSRALIPHRLRISIHSKLNELNSKEAQYPPMNPETRRQLTKHFTPSVHRLSEMLDRDLTHWLNVSD